MSETSLQYQLNEKRGQFSLVPVPRPTPTAEEVVIRTKAIGLNGLNWKSRDFGIMVEEWPAVFGLDGAGIVEAVGESVSTVKPGGEVFSLAGMGNRAGSFQELYTVASNLVAKKPSSWSFEEAATVPIVYLTAAAAIVNGFKVPLPHLDPSGTPNSALKSALVLGGSSGVGASAIQLLRLANPSLTILATSAAKHHNRLISLGATKVFERSAQDDPSAIKAATPDGAGVDGILDTVTATIGQPAVFTALNPTGPKLYSQVITGPQNPQTPEGVTATPIIARLLFSTPGGANALPALPALVESGKFKLPLKTEIVGEGFESIAPALDKVMRGASGEKYVVSL